MPYLIDGHNLIPHMHNMSLQQVDDEEKLLAILEPFFRKISKKATIFFDRGQPGAETVIKRGFVTARFVRPPLIADQVIRAQLRQLGGAARNYTVVSGDREVSAYAQNQGARTLTSREFASRVYAQATDRQSTRKNPESSEDTDYWLNLFKKNS